LQRRPDKTAVGRKNSAILLLPRAGFALNQRRSWNKARLASVDLMSGNTIRIGFNMAHAYSPSTVAIAGQPVHWLLVQFPVVCFTLALFTDLSYWGTAYSMWHNFSAWLLFAGIVFGAIAAIIGLVELLFGAHRPGWAQVIGSVIVLALALLNNLVHAGDGWTAIVPWGLALSAATVIAMIVSGWYGRGFVSHRAMGVSDHD
jgi:uncharacterized membrane protein